FCSFWSMRQRTLGNGRSRVADRALDRSPNRHPMGRKVNSAYIGQEFPRSMTTRHGTELVDGFERTIDLTDSRTPITRDGNALISEIDEAISRASATLGHLREKEQQDAALHLVEALTRVLIRPSFRHLRRLANARDKVSVSLGIIRLYDVAMRVHHTNECRDALQRWKQTVEGARTIDALQGQYRLCATLELAARRSLAAGFSKLAYSRMSSAMEEELKSTLERLLAVSQGTIIF
ncbi:hypothetical protein FOZ63_002931, partial [Perkinsus olseni]